LLLFGNAAVHTPDLQIPHPRMHERAFVLKPLLEIAPHLPFTIDESQQVERID
jgi:2-amino-4-hydroxy-6-hydroxymethyldihydropteridine diphosphokinase